MAADLSWLDVVPGARAAYNFIVEKLSEFNLIGLQKVPQYETIAQTLGDQVRASGDTQLNAMLDAVQQGTTSLKSDYEALRDRVAAALQQFKSLGLSGLGQVPWGAVIAVATVLVTVGGAMFLFFQRAQNHDQLVRDFLDQSVSKGLISADRATQLLSGSGGSGIGTLGTGLIVLALVVGAVYFLPRPRRARAA